MFIEELAAKHLRKFLKIMDRIGLRIYTYRLKLRTKTKKRLSNILFNVVTYLDLIDWIIEQIDVRCEVDRDLLRVLTYRTAIENNYEVLQRWKTLDTIPIEQLRLESINALKYLDQLPLIKRIALKYSYPEFFVRRLSKFLGTEELIKLLATMNTRPKYTWLCVNTARYERDDVISILESEGFMVREDEDFDDVIRVESKPKRIEKSIAYKRGMFIIADKASVACTHVLKPQDGDTILDMCAAPGIKLLCTAFKMNHGRIIAVDISKSRMKRLLKITRRYSIPREIRIETHVMDSRRLNRDIVNNADKIIIDAECSSTGLIAKSPDVKLRIKRERIKELSTLQCQLLLKGLSLGEGLNTKYIVYSVCSLLPEEGEFVVLHARNHTRYRVSRLDIASPAYLDGTGRRFFPHKHGTIGLFVARFEDI